MGLVVNKLIDQLTMAELMKQLSIEGDGLGERGTRPFRRPGRGGRGFVLHSADYVEQARWSWAACRR